MPRFAANLSMMFTEAPFIERFAAAAEAGFQAVEFLFPYDFAASEIKAQLSRHNLTLALLILRRAIPRRANGDVPRYRGANTTRAPISIWLWNTLWRWNASRFTSWRA